MINASFHQAALYLSRSIIPLLLAGCMSPETTSSAPRSSDRDELAHVISQKVKSTFSYPDRAKRTGWEGWVLVEALITTDGSLAGIEVYRHSGCTDLVVDAIETVENIFLIPSRIPLGRGELLSVAVPIHYELDQASTVKPSGDLYSFISDSLTSTIRAIQQDPEAAKKPAGEGVAIIKFMVEPDGTITDAKIHESSGHRDLDEHALATIQAVRSVHDRRCSSDARRVEVQFPVQYVLQDTDRAAGRDIRRNYDWLAREMFDRLREVGFYPVQAVRSGWEGTVVVSTIVKEDGTISYSWIDRSSSIPLLDQAAMQTVRSLSPLKLKYPLGRPRTIVTLPITYSQK